MINCNGLFSTYYVPGTLHVTSYKPQRFYMWITCFLLQTQQSSIKTLSWLSNVSALCLQRSCSYSQVPSMRLLLKCQLILSICLQRIQLWFMLLLLQKKNKFYYILISNIWYFVIRVLLVFSLYCPILLINVFNLFKKFL